MTWICLVPALVLLAWPCPSACGVSSRRGSPTSRRRAGDPRSPPDARRGAQRRRLRHLGPRADDPAARASDRRRLDRSDGRARGALQPEGRLEIVVAGDLPAGWRGKVHALPRASRPAPSPGSSSSTPTRVPRRSSWRGRTPPRPSTGSTGSRSPGTRRRGRRARPSWCRPCSPCSTRCSATGGGPPGATDLPSPRGRSSSSVGRPRGGRRLRGDSRRHDRRRGAVPCPAPRGLPDRVLASPGPSWTSGCTTGSFTPSRGGGAASGSTSPDARPSRP